MTDQPDLFDIKDTPMHPFGGQGEALVTDVATGKVHTLEPRVGIGSGSEYYGDTSQHKKWSNGTIEDEMTLGEQAEAKKRIDNVSKVAKRFGDTYEAKVYPGGTYPGQGHLSHHAVVYHKPTGEAVGRMQFDNGGNVGIMAVHPDHQMTGATPILADAASKYLRSIGHTLGIPSSDETTDDSAKILKKITPNSSHMDNRWDPGELDAEDYLKPNDFESNNIPQRLGDTKKSWEDFAKLSDETGRHPGNFMLLDPNPAVQHEGRNLLQRTGQRPDPTVLALLAPREEAKKQTMLQKHEDAAVRARTLRADALLTGSRSGAFALHNPDDMRSRAIEFSNHVWGDNTEPDSTGESLRSHPFYRGAKPSESSPVAKAVVAADPGAIHDAVWTGEEEPEPYKPRTTQERLDQDPLARARILRGRNY